MNPTVLSRRLCLAQAAGLVLLPPLLAGCASLGGPSVITLGQADLDRLLESRFPLQRRLLEWLDVSLSRPTLQLLPERNRIAVAVAVLTQERLSARAARLTLGFDSALRFEPRDASLRLNTVRVQRLGLESAASAGPDRATRPGLPAPATAAGEPPAGYLARLGQALAEQALENLALYSVPADRLAALRRLGLQPGAVTVTARGVEITLASTG